MFFFIKNYDLNFNSHDNSRNTHGIDRYGDIHLSLRLLALQIYDTQRVFAGKTPPRITFLRFSTNWVGVRFQWPIAEYSKTTFIDTENAIGLKAVILYTSVKLSPFLFRTRLNVNPVFSNLIFLLRTITLRYTLVVFRKTL